MTNEPDPPPKHYTPSWAWWAYAGSVVAFLLPFLNIYIGCFPPIVLFTASFVLSAIATAGVTGNFFVSNRPVKGRCANCKYDLSGLKSPPKCPECGTPIDWTPKS